ncbi:ATP-binding protein [uncultured Prevotella sp.]|uniref:ATP-binding protein n=1 Tax=uncultured Prevotella sp. TaxID=159272 RepID=UPI0026277E53|nr:ATP-binding protein [uncultured Prevotella sp.]
MVETNENKLPVGIQSFEKIRKGGYLYVDKTDIIWQLANRDKTYNYLSRPRRFGKSVLVDTLEAYFLGKKELFEGLKIMELETEWVKRPVIRLDMSCAGAEPDTLRSYLDITFDRLEKEYGITPKPTAQLADRFNAIIQTACTQTGHQVAILIDEYDSPLQHSWKTPHHEACTAIYREVFAILKANDKYEKFVFITGITKFTQISLFSVLNNLSNISFEPEYAAICGITKEEVLLDFKPEINKLAEYEGWTYDEAVAQLTAYYDGYHFSRRNMVDVFNPFSLINALADSDLKNYWASSGATSLLPKFVDDMELKLGNFDPCTILRQTIETSDVTGGGAELFLYQSGYLTIKDYQMGVYILGFPNYEVRQALYETVLPALTLRGSGDVQSTQSGLFLALQLGNLPEAMKCLKALIADVPYSNKKLASMDMEERYRLILSTIFNAIGCQVEVEKMIATGRIDMVVGTTNFIYVLELKLTNNGGIDAATELMRAKQYAEPFKADRRKVTALAIELDDMGKGLVDWKEVTSF